MKRLFSDGKKLPDNKQILKYEIVSDGNRRSLIVKNVSKNDYGKYSVSTGSDKLRAKFRNNKQRFTKAC